MGHGFLWGKRCRVANSEIRAVANFDIRRVANLDIRRVSNLDIRSVAFLEMGGRVIRWVRVRCSRLVLGLGVSIRVKG